MKIIEAKEEHIPVIRNIAYQTWPDTFKDILSASQIEYMLERMYSHQALKYQLDHNHRFMIAEINSEPVAFTSYECNYNGSQQTKLHKLYILPGLQGKGIGVRLIEEVTSWAIKAKNNMLTLNVNRFNKARYFYEKLGFSIMQEEDIDIGNGFLMQDYVMEKLL